MGAALHIEAAQSTEGEAQFTEAAALYTAEAGEHMSRIIAEVVVGGSFLGASDRAALLAT